MHGIYIASIYGYLRYLSLSKIKCTENIFHGTTILALYCYHSEYLLLNESHNCASTPALSSLNLRFALLTFARYHPLALCGISHRVEMKMALPKRASKKRGEKSIEYNG